MQPEERGNINEPDAQVCCVLHENIVNDFYFFLLFFTDNNFEIFIHAGLKTSKQAQIIKLKTHARVGDSCFASVS